jgi:DNA-binding response OmpR family regulator
MREGVMGGTKIRVLVVDDDPVQLLLAERSLQMAGFEVQTHSTTFGVTNLVRTTLPDVVLLDVNIPALRGDRVLALARAHAAKDTQFILYSAEDENKLRLLALECGADGYLSKDVWGMDLGRKLLELYHRRRAATSPILEPGEGAPPPAPRRER